MIKFRDINYAIDIPEIIELIHLGLSDKNTIDSFMWKHSDNPFGKSIGLLACDKNKIVGVRLFMFWEFKKGEKIVKAIRPVDTIIHPDYRGKGLFKELTLAGLLKFKNEYNLIFNTPNKNSFPGYIKMGWKSFEGMLNFKVAFVLPFISKKVSLKKVDNNLISIHDLKLDYNYFRTHLTDSYLRWRYKDPIYKIASINVYGVNSVIIYRLEKIKGIKTLIINEIIGDFKVSSIAIRQLVSKEMVFLVYYLDNTFLKLNFVFSKRKGDAVVVYRDDSYSLMKDVYFSSGDLEGRL